MRSLIAFASMFRSASAEAIRASLLIIDWSVSSDAMKLTWRDIDNLLEEFHLSVPDDDVWDALIDSGLFIEVDKSTLGRTDQVELRRFHGDVGLPDQAPIAIEAVAKIIPDCTPAEHKASVVDLLQV